MTQYNFNTNKQKMKYSHLNKSDRTNIAYLYNVEKLSYLQIGKKIGRSDSSIKREIERNGIKRKNYIKGENTKYLYNANAAHKRSMKKKERLPKEKFPEFITFFNENIKHEHTLEEIRGMFIRAIEKGKISKECKVPSLATLYNWAHKKKLTKPGCARFFFFKRQRNKRQNFQILKRNIVHRGKFFKGSDFPPGHFEIDLVLSPYNKGGILTLTEPATLMIYSRHVESKSVKHVLRAINSILSNELSPDDVITITSDNGREFFGYRYVEKRYDISWFFCDPYRSSQRASNERLNRDIRVYYPKGVDFAKISPLELQNTIDIINSKVRRKFNYLSAKERKEEIKKEIPDILKSQKIINLIKTINDNQNLFCS